MLFNFIIICMFSFFSATIFGANIGVLIMATGKYIQFVDPLMASAEEYFCKDHNVTYFIFTDSDLPSKENVVYIHQDRLGWPFDTMNRYHAYLASQDVLQKQDYLFACDADMLFVGEVGDEILGKLVATQHAGFIKTRGTYERNPKSKACVFDYEGEQYFAGGFYGGETKEILAAITVNVNNINDDLERGIIAIWHDESHWNRYCIDHKPTVVLSFFYCYPESWDNSCSRKLLALDKNHEEMRKN